MIRAAEASVDLRVTGGRPAVSALACLPLSQYTALFGGLTGAPGECMPFSFKVSVGAALAVTRRLLLIDLCLICCVLAPQQGPAHESRLLTEATG